MDAVRATRILHKSTTGSSVWKIQLFQWVALADNLAPVFFTPSTDFLFTAHCTVAEQCSREYAETRVLPPENLALSWLSHSASILTHLNESVSRSSVGGGLPYPSFLFCAHQQLLQYKYSYQETKTHNLCLQSF